jgi:hypothetical protein
MNVITVKLPVLNVKAKGTNVIPNKLSPKRMGQINASLFSYCPLFF